MATTQQQQAASIIGSVVNGTQQTNVSGSSIAAKNLNTYKNIVFPAPYNYLDLAKITRAIDNRLAVTYLTFDNKSYTIPSGILS